MGLSRLCSGAHHELLVYDGDALTAALGLGIVVGIRYGDGVFKMTAPSLGSLIERATSRHTHDVFYRTERIALLVQVPILVEVHREFSRLTIQNHQQFR